MKKQGVVVHPKKEPYIEVVINPAFPTASFYSVNDNNQHVCELENALIAYGRPFNNSGKPHKDTRTPIGTNVRIIEKRFPFYFTKYRTNADGTHVTNRLGHVIFDKLLTNSRGQPIDYDNSYALRMNIMKEGAGYAYWFHFTTEVKRIGKGVSSGCIRMYSNDIRKLYFLAETNTRVDIHYNLARIVDDVLYISGDRYRRGVDISEEVFKELTDYYGDSFTNQPPQQKLIEICEKVSNAQRNRWNKYEIDLKEAEPIETYDFGKYLAIENSM